MTPLTSPNNPLISVLEEFGITLPANAVEWRVCGSKLPAVGAHRDIATPVQHIGRFILGEHFLHGTVSMLATDGVVAWFLLGDHKTVFFGHVRNFKPEVEPKVFTPRPAASAPKGPTKRQLELTEMD